MGKYIRSVPPTPNAEHLRVTSIHVRLLLRVASPKSKARTEDHGEVEAFTNVVELVQLGARLVLGHGGVVEVLHHQGDVAVGEAGGPVAHRGPGAGARGTLARRFLSPTPQGRGTQREREDTCILSGGPGCAMDGRKP